MRPEWCCHPAISIEGPYLQVISKHFERKRDREQWDSAGKDICDTWKKAHRRYASFASELNSQYSLE